MKRTRYTSFLFMNNISSLIYETMFNSKSAVDDYVNELNRLFHKSETIDPLTMANYTSPFQTAVTNKSSSSPDSISPDPYFEMPFYNRHSELRTRCETPKPTNNRSEHGSSSNIYDPKSVYGSPNLNMSPRNMIENRGIFESPPSFKSYHSYDKTTYRNFDLYTPGDTESSIPMRRQRPIVGRNILGSSQLIQENETSWQIEGLPLTPPERNHKSYELFPAEKQILELNTSFKNPIKPPNFEPLSNSSNSSNLSHSSLNYTQNPNISRLQTLSRFPLSNYSSVDDIGPSTMCTFCRKNGETPVVYMTHCVKKKMGNRHIVTCPVLRSHVCLTCGASGDNAHTITYCPVLRSSNNGKPLQSTTITLKNTRVKSNGKRRF